MADNAWMLAPVWSSDIVYCETMAMIEEDGVCEASFARKPGKILKVESYDRQTTYEQGKDFEIVGNKLVLTKDSAIPHTTWDIFFLDTEEQALKDRDDSPSKFGCTPIKTTDGRYVTVFGIGNPQFVTKWQICVTYETDEAWQGYAPKPSLQKLPRLAEKLSKGEPVTIVLYGDSISVGFDCSGIYNQEPHQPIWGELVMASLRERFTSPITFYNPSVAGVDSDWAFENLQERVNDKQPDLVILGWGMNDRCTGEEFGVKAQKLIDGIHEANPDAEIVLMASSLANELTETPPFWFCANQRDHGSALAPLCKEGIVLADIGSMQKELMKQKRYIDLTGNWLNHPNDYLARVQAQIVNTVLS